MLSFIFGLPLPIILIGVGLIFGIIFSIFKKMLKVGIYLGALFVLILVISKLMNFF